MLNLRLQNRNPQTRPLLIFLPYMQSESLEHKACPIADVIYSPSSPPTTGTHIQRLLQLLRSSLEVLRLLQLLLQLVQEGVLLLQVGEQLTPTCPHLLQRQRQRLTSEWIQIYIYFLNRRLFLTFYALWKTAAEKRKNSERKPALQPSSWMTKNSVKMRLKWEWHRGRTER